MLLKSLIHYLPNNTRVWNQFGYTLRNNPGTISEPIRVYRIEVTPNRIYTFLIARTIQLTHAKSRNFTPSFMLYLKLFIYFFCNLYTHWFHWSRIWYNSRKETGLPRNECLEDGPHFDRPMSAICFSCKFIMMKLNNA